MEYSIEGLKEFKKAPVFKLLGQPYILLFLHKEFIEFQNGAIPEAELVESWGQFRQRYPEATTVSDDKGFVHKWTNEENMWLYLRAPENGVRKYELSPITIEAFKIIEDHKSEDAQDYAIPVTQSFQNMINSMRVLEDNFNPNKTKRIKSYEKQIEELQQKIDEIKEKKNILIGGGNIEEMTQYDIEANYLNIKTTLQQLLFDAPKLIKKLHSLYIQMNEIIQDDEKTANELMQEWAKARIELQKSEAGQAFQCFVDYTLDETQMEWMKNFLYECRNYPYIGEQAKKHKLWKALRRLDNYINDANKENDKMYKCIYNSISADNFEDNQCIRKLLRKIIPLLQKAKYIDEAETPRLKYFSTPERPVSQIIFPQISIKENDEQDMLEVEEAKPVKSITLDTLSIDREKLQKNVDECLAQGKSKLSEIIKEHPLSEKLELDEILEYLSISKYTKKWDDKKIIFQAHNRIHNIVEEFSTSDVEYEGEGKNEQRTNNNGNDS